MAYSDYVSCGIRLRFFFYWIISFFSSANYENDTLNIKALSFSIFLFFTFSLTSSCSNKWPGMIYGRDDYRVVIRLALYLGKGMTKSWSPSSEFNLCLEKYGNRNLRWNLKCLSWKEMETGEGLNINTWQREVVSNFSSFGCSLDGGDTVGWVFQFCRHFRHCRKFCKFSENFKVFADDLSKNLNVLN